MNNTGVEITAGLGGFLVVFALGLTVWLLSRDLSKRLRRMRLREQERVDAVRREAARAVAEDESAPPTEDPLS
ncbi:MAG: hypothetical protein Q4P07_06760 [Ornithinimicrobium sp.]|uniref:hypothetical protein n=1 Tax=Ornithinimicrobium sp. TaxID=1977084 RepID=UPI0026DF9F29|nr:hypothetical protein [Ornithinimicrobium sp.]MDO5739833.1 hypothetical protein [Ornithinimicrobium sp.]